MDGDERKAGETYEVLALRYATSLRPRSTCFADYVRRGEPDGEARLDYFFWVARNEARTIVIDTGSSAAATAARGRAHLAEPMELLRSVGVEPAEVETLVMTHLHYDHTGNIDAFPRAQVTVSERELAFWEDPVSRLEIFSHLIEEADLAHVAEVREQGRLRLVGDVAEVAPGITATCVGGHTPGQQIIEIPTASGPLVLTSDASHFYEEIEEDRMFIATIDFAGAFRALARLRDLRAAGKTLIAGHDPLVCERHPARDGGLVHRLA